MASTASSTGSESSTPANAPPPTVAMSNSSADTGNKLKTFLSILRKFIGVNDMAAQRFSLPAQLMEPIPNLEYWHYLDRPETFAAIGDSDDDLGRMLGALRFWFTKDLKYVKGKPCKPYNSVLGEFFRCNWDLEELPPPVIGSGNSSTTETKKPTRISFLTEQTSHHPPVSAYFIHCPDKGITARGFDQLLANFTGTRIRVAPGVYNEGIFVTLHNRDDEQYHLTHPVAHLGGLLKGSFSVTVADQCTITCAKTKLKAILYYVEEGWMGKTQNRMQGVIFRYDPANDTIKRYKDVPESDIVGRVEGCWHEQIYFSPGSKPMSDNDRQLVVDLAPLFPVPKTIPPETEQLPNESRKMWQHVTEAIHAKQWAAATAAKQEIEERQRARAADRKARNYEWKPRFFTAAVTPAGRPELTEDGWAVLKGMAADQYKLEPSKETAV